MKLIISHPEARVIVEEYLEKVYGFRIVASENGTDRFVFAAELKDDLDDDYPEGL